MLPSLFNIPHCWQFLSIAFCGTHISYHLPLTCVKSRNRVHSEPRSNSFVFPFLYKAPPPYLSLISFILFLIIGGIFFIIFIPPTHLYYYLFSSSLSLCLHFYNFYPLIPYVVYTSRINLLIYLMGTFFFLLIYIYISIFPIFFFLLIYIYISWLMYLYIPLFIPSFEFTFFLSSPCQRCEYNSVGRMPVCGTGCHWFDSNYSPLSLLKVENPKD